MTAAELRSLLDSIVKGATRETVTLSLTEFVSLYDQLLKRVDQDRTDVTVVLADGKGIVTFPRLSRQVLTVVERRPLGRADLRLTTPGKVTVIGGDHRVFRTYLGEDLQAAWYLPVLLLLLTLGASWATDIGSLSAVLAPSLALASSVFFAIFVLFGVGEISRVATLQARLFNSGLLQQYLDADRYLVRLAILSFVLSLATVAVVPIRIGFLARAAASLPPWVPDASMGVVLVLLWLSAVSTLLCLKAAAGYLLDRAGGTLLAGMGYEAIQAPDLPHAPGSPAEDVEASVSRS
jgi:hypothetical protein